MSRVLVSDDGGSVRVSEAALVHLVDGAVSAVEGARLRRRRRLSLELADGRARAELEVAVAYGNVLPRRRGRCRRVSDCARAACVASRSTLSTWRSWS